MARYPYRAELPEPGKWSGIDFSDPKLEQAVRLMVRGIRAEVGNYQPPISIDFRPESFTVWDGGEITCYVFEPKAHEGDLPAMLYCHGGGFFMPVQPMMMTLAAEYAEKLSVRVYLPEYRILPEYRNPYPFRDCLSILEVIMASGSDYLLYGESAGGAIAAGLAAWVRDHNLTPAEGQCLIYPVLDNRMSRYPSARLYSDAAWTLKNNLSMWREYLKNGKDGLEDYLIPMQIPEVSGLPQAYVEPQEIDILRDEAIAYAKRLEEAGGIVTLNLVEGSYHGFDAATDNAFVQSVVEKRLAVMRQMLID